MGESFEDGIPKVVQNENELSTLLKLLQCDYMSDRSKLVLVAESKLSDEAIAAIREDTDGYGLCLEALCEAYHHFRELGMKSKVEFSENQGPAKLRNAFRRRLEQSVLYQKDVKDERFL